MAGRPRKMVKRVEEFEKLAVRLSFGLFEIVPKQYLDDPDGSDSLSTAWKDCVEAAFFASIACEHLGDILRSRAGITEPGPTKEFWSDAPDGAELALEKVGKGENRP